MVSVLCAAALGYKILASPTILIVAVGPRDTVEATLVRTFAEALEQDGRDVRLVLRPHDDLLQSARALQDGQAHLAVVRPDVFLPYVARP